MSIKRKIGTIAALGTSTAALAMLTGLAGAHADELSDLRANQQLLSQRVDQLAPDVRSGFPKPAEVIIKQGLATRKAMEAF